MPTVKHVTLSERLSRLGLVERMNQLKNLNVKAGTEVRISSGDKHHAKRMARLPVKSARELKHLLGVPEGAVGQDTPARANPERFVSSANGFPFLPFPAVPLRDKAVQARLMSYLLTTTKLRKPTGVEKRLLVELDDSIRQAAIVVAVFLAADIHVEEGATLIVDKDIQFLFGNHIILEDEASIIMESPVSRIDCARMRFVRS
jgi:hypothetical protein